MSDLAVYLIESKDYDFERSMAHSVTLGGYVEICAKYCIKRYKSARYAEESMFIQNAIYDEEEIDTLNIIEDMNSSREMELKEYDIKQCIGNLANSRYIEGNDMLMVLYVRALTLNVKDKKRREKIYCTVLDALCIDRRRFKANDSMYDAIKAIAIEKELGGSPEDEIAKYVYSADSIKNTVEELILKLN